MRQSARFQSVNHQYNGVPTNTDQHNIGVSNALSNAGDKVQHVHVASISMSNIAGDNQNERNNANQEPEDKQKDQIAMNVVNNVESPLI